MSKDTVDVNERTFEQEKKDFVTVCKVFEAACIAVLCAIGAVMAIMLGVLIALGTELSIIAVLSVNCLLLILGMTSALNLGRAIFKSLKSGETPFRYDIADKVKGASLALVCSGVLSILVQSVSGIFCEAFSDILPYFFLIAVVNCFVGVLLGIMSYVMNYGCKLQQESDETL